MKCKPGDIAMVITGEMFGATFYVIEPAPVVVDFKLPNGVLHDAVPAGYWVLESLCGDVPTEGIGHPKVTIGCGPDKKLMPIGRNNVEALLGAVRVGA